MWFANKAALRAGRVNGNDWDAANIGLHSVSFGYNTRAAGIYGFSTGNNTSASGEAAAAFNYNTGATGENATAFGQETDAQAMGSFVIGRYNVATGSTNTWVEADPLFVVGNGYTFENPPGILNIQRRNACLLNTSPSPRDRTRSRMPSSA